MLGKGNRRIDAHALARTALAAVILIGLGVEAVGQGLLFRNDVHSMIPIWLNNSTSVAMGDVDGDGDLDAFFGNAEYQQNQLYVNDGNGVFTNATAQIPEDIPENWGYTLAVALGDVDGDGDLDAFIGNVGQNRLYLNDGDGVFTDATAQIPEDSDYTESVALGDVDGDGDLDAFLGRYGQNGLYLNDGSGVFTDATSQIPTDSHWTLSVSLGDVDGDGDLDAFLGNRLYLNDGNGLFTDATSQIPADSDDTFAVALGDVDGDGDLDAFLGKWGQNRLYLNDGGGVFTDATSQIPTDSDETSAVALGDLDGDGDLDAFLGNGDWDHGQQNRLYMNDGNGTFNDATAQVLPLDEDSTWAVGLGDVDGDGDLDAFLGGATDDLGFTPQQDRLYLNDGNGVFADATDQTLPEIGSTLALGDVDGDGDLDAFLGNRLYLNDGNGVFTDATNQIPEGEPGPVAFGDVDGDGDLDAFLGNGLYLNDGNGVFTDATNQIPESGSRGVALGDVDGDGDLDAFLSCSGGGNRLYLNDGNGVFTDATDQIPGGHCGRTVALGDVDGDGDLDALFGTYNIVIGTGRSDGGTNLYLNDGNGVFTDASSQVPQLAIATAAVALGDVDGDGDLDAFLGTGVYHENGSWDEDHLYLNDGSGVFTDATSQLPESYRLTYTIALGDVDGDGDLDAFFGKYLYLNDGTGIFTDATDQISVGEWWNTDAIVLGDLDGDGDLDAFARHWPRNRLYTNLTRQLAWRGIPRIGKRLDLDLHGPADGTYILGISRHETYRPKPPRGVLKIHPGYVLHTTEGTLDSDGHALLTYDLPDDPSLVGKSFYWQALVKSPGRFTNLEITTLTDL